MRLWSQRAVRSAWPCELRARPREIPPWPARSACHQRAAGPARCRAARCRSRRTASVSGALSAPGNLSLPGSASPPRQVSQEQQRAWPVSPPGGEQSSATRSAPATGPVLSQAGTALAPGRECCSASSRRTTPLPEQPFQTSARSSLRSLGRPLVRPSDPNRGRTGVNPLRVCTDPVARATTTFGNRPAAWRRSPRLPPQATSRRSAAHAGGESHHGDPATRILRA